jgi:hydrogenase nickel incorporation protein HypA/HybF
MHELSVARNIVDIVCQSVPQERLNDVSAVALRIGDQAGIVCDSLEFSFHVLTTGTPLADTSLVIEHIPYRVHCNTCRRTFESPFGLGICPNCSGTDTTVVSGTEMQVTTIDLDEPQEAS